MKKKKKKKIKQLFGLKEKKKKDTKVFINSEVEIGGAENLMQTKHNH